MPARTVEVAFLGNTTQLEAALKRAGLVSQETADKIATSAKAAGDAAARQAKAAGASADEQVDAAGRAAGAYTDMAAKMSAAQRSAGDAAAQASRKVGASLDEQQAAFTRAAGAQKAYEDQAKRAAAATEASAARMKQAHESLSNLGKWTLGAGIGIAALSVKGAVDLQTQMEQLKTLAGASQQQVQKLTQGVMNMAGAVGVGPNELAQGMYHVVSSLNATLPAAQRSADELKILKVAAEGARMGGANLVDVTNALDAVMVSGIKGIGNYSQSMGQLRAAVGAGDMTMQDMADALSTGILANVSRFGVSLNQVSGALAVFGDNNMRGAAAATKLQSAIRIMGAPSVAASQALGAIGLSALQLNQDMHQGGLIQALADLKKHLKDSGATAEQQGLILTRAFGGRQSTGVMVLLKQLERLRAKTQQVGAGANSFSKDYAAYNKTLGAEWQHAEAAIEALADKLGTALIPKLQQLAQDVRSVVSWFEAHKAAAEALAAIITGVLSAAVTTFAVGKLGAMVNGIRGAVSWLKTFGVTAEATAAETDAALGSTGIGAVIVVLGVAITELATHWGTVMSGMKDAVNAMVQAAETALNGLISALNAAISVFNSTIGKLTGDIGKVGSVGVSPAFGGGSYGPTVKNGRNVAPPGFNPGGKDMAPVGFLTPAENTNAKALMGYLMAGGLAPSGAAALIGNWVQESSLNPNDNGPSGLGLAQWMGGRRSGEQSYAASHHLAWNSLQAQSGWALQELQGQPSLLAALKRGGDAASLALAVSNQYERPSQKINPATGIPYANNPAREQYAAAIAQAYGLSSSHTSKHHGKTHASGSHGPATSSLTGYLNGTGTTTSSASKTLTSPAARLTEQADELLQSMHSGIQNGTISSLENVSGAHTHGIVGKINGMLASGNLSGVKGLLAHSARGSGAVGNLNQVVKTLDATHRKGMEKLATRLVNTHKQVLATLADELYSLHATDLANMANAITQVMQATGQKMADSVAAMATAVKDRSAIATDAATAKAQKVSDSAQIVADKLAERGLYGLNLTAQQQTVTLDQMKQKYDRQLNSSQSKVDQTQKRTDATISAAQKHVDTITRQQDLQIKAAQRRVDQVASGTQAQQQAAAAGLTAAQAHAAQLEQRAQNALSHAQAQAGLQLANAQAALAQVKNQSQVAEAEQQAIVQKTQAMAATQFAGSGLTINIEGINPTDAAAVASAVGWKLRTQVPV